MVSKFNKTLWNDQPKILTRKKNTIDKLKLKVKIWYEGLYVAYKSLQMQMIGRSKILFAPVFPRFRFASDFLLQLIALSKTLMAAWNQKISSRTKKLKLTQNVNLTWGAPSISSMIKQLGLGSASRTDFIWVVSSSFFRKTSALRSSLQQINNCHYWRSFSRTE